ncbi:MAG: helicase HerA domain-containing protein [Pseudanabaena sp.]|jgi:hypothetical protein
MSYYATKLKCNIIASLATVSGLAILFLSLLGFNQLRWVKYLLLSLGATVSAGGVVARSIAKDTQSANLDLLFTEKVTRLTTLIEPLPVLEGQFVESSTPAIATDKPLLKTSQLPEIIEPPSDWLIKVCLMSNHFRVNGQTGSGKSTFMLNLLTILVKSFEARNQNVEVIIIDPKYPFSDWGSYTPSYKGLDESLDGLEAMSKTVLERLALARECADHKRPLPVFRPQLWVIDEIDMIVSEYEKLAAKHLKTGLKVGRALGVKLAYVGQTPLADDLKLRRNDFNNSTNIFLGSNCLAGVDEICYTGQQKSFLTGQLAAREELEQKYFALVKPPSLPPFTAQLPQENAYGQSLPSLEDSKILEAGEDSKINASQSSSNKLTAIKALKQSGEDRISVIICKVWGLGSASGRAYQSAREEYRKLTGE